MAGQAALYWERKLLDITFGGPGSGGTFSGTTITAGQAAVVSIPCVALVDAIAANEFIWVSVGSGNMERFQVTGAGAAASATSIPVVSKTSAFAHATNDLIAREVTYMSVPATLWLALSTAVYSSAVVEPVGNNYGRLSVANTPAQWSDATGSVPASKTNANALNFAAPSGSWGACQSFAIYDASSSGNLLYQGALTNPETPTTGAPASFAAGALIVQAN